ncbi:hypothetical protein K5V07_05900 [Flavobacterium sp. CHNK8]|jgi:hypothetical protein|uniref:hypothetical protein n=1 Tax=unclassified Flavobacterium TaxID=196869 RepID=UPI001594D8BA|nr:MULTISPECIES: hypothetical protein [unclassified Flavobacterium]QZK90047.1 hypothetical protein K5V07_05900 [Flavobacterium sp. CHNK8]CAH0335433.1 hypothetical protein FVB9288_01076 [Flavobacterium sp. CECT 9288]
MQKIATRISLLSFLLITLSSCSIVKGIFKAGVGVGIFLVIAVIAILLFIITKIFKRK